MENQNAKTLAPEHQKMKNYTNKLIAICICYFYKEFAHCIYKGEKMPLAAKKCILVKMHGLQPTNNQKSKLDNYLNWYKVYLQEESKYIIDTAMEYVMLSDIQRRELRIVIKPLEKENKNFKTSEIPANISEQEIRSNDAFIKYTRQEIYDIVGFNNEIDEHLVELEKVSDKYNDSNCTEENLTDHKKVKEDKHHLLDVENPCLNNLRKKNYKKKSICKVLPVLHYSKCVHFLFRFICEKVEDCFMQVGAVTYFHD
ncbi:uncharacterized protein LOC116415691 [Nasonia vitripennis]|uniref:Uncharacterized protein n=1 Tax=Nasonia vitripennis TaxID=7425 RepID=A0A7M7QKJ0_NASVI|nr:uncharacterized protein LOC116415691 [Nasonia vitripennis]